MEERQITKRCSRMATKILRFIEGRKSVGPVRRECDRLFREVSKSHRASMNLLSSVDMSKSDSRVATRRQVEVTLIVQNIYHCGLQRVIRFLNSSSSSSIVYTQATVETFLSQFPYRPDLAQIIKGEGMRLRLPVAPFTLSWKGLKDVSFENMVLSIYIPQTHDSSISVCLAKEDTSRGIHQGTTAHWHPHVNGVGGICFGAGANLVHVAKAAVDFIGLYVVTVQILRTYNHTGAFQHLNGFTTQSGTWCSGNESRCGRWLPRKWIEDVAAHQCPKCSIVYCKTCISKFGLEVSKKEECATCDKEMNKLKEQAKEQDKEQAKEPRMICQRCLSRRENSGLYICHSCKKRYCAEHWHGIGGHHSCSVCGNYRCGECSTYCPTGDHYVCKKCEGEKSRKAHDSELAAIGICRDCEVYYPHACQERLKEHKHKRKLELENKEDGDNNQNDQVPEEADVHAESVGENEVDVQEGG